MKQCDGYTDDLDAQLVKLFIGTCSTERNRDRQSESRLHRRGDCMHELEESSSMFLVPNVGRFFMSKVVVFSRDANRMLGEFILYLICNLMTN